MGLLIFLAILGLSATLTLRAGAALQQREKEEELLFIGSQFQSAFRSYKEATPPGYSSYPKSLDDLLKDPRRKALRRHLRKVYADPMTGKEWGVEEAPEGGIAGVFSKSDAHAIKKSGFPSFLSNLEGKQKYSEWVFGD